MLVSQKCHRLNVGLKGNIQSELIVAKKHNIVARAMQIEFGGNTYRLRPTWVMMPDTVGLMDRTDRAKTRRSNALIANRSGGRSIT